jgi:hypothetical protein
MDSSYRYNDLKEYMTMLNRKHTRIAFGVLFSMLALYSLCAIPTFARQNPPDNTSEPATQQTLETVANGGGTTDSSIPQNVVEGNSRAGLSVLHYLADLSHQTDTTILADRSVAREVIVPPSHTTQPTELETMLTQLVQNLPKGTLWAKVYLPAKGQSGSISQWNPDAVADYLIIQSQLFGNVGAPTPEGTIEIMGKKLSGNTANTVTNALHLKPVYIVLNPLQRDIVAHATISGVQNPQNPSQPPLPPSSSGTIPRY